MKRKATRLLAIALTVVMCLQTFDLGIVFAAGETFDPESQIQLTVPESLQDGNNYFFIREAGFSVSEKSLELMYIPIQRTGNTDAEADVSLKVADITAHYGVNYTAEIYNEKTQPEVVNDGMAVIDIAQNADGQEEVEETDPNELGQTLMDSGGADMVDAAGNTVGRLTADPLAEAADPAVEGQPEEAQAQPDADVSAAPAEDGASMTGRFVSPDNLEPANAEVVDFNGSDSPQDLRQARDQFTGTVSDRQEMEGSDEFLPGVSSSADGAKTRMP